MSEYRYEKMRWKELDDAAKNERVVIIPVACIEDHGPHLPVDVDVAIVSAICERAAKMIPDRVLLFPTIQNGFTPHHMDFPGSITILWKRFVEYLVDITASLAHHGFRRMIIVNGHGSNTPLVETASRLTVVNNPHVLCSGLSWWQIPKLKEAVGEFRQSEFPGGMNHSCELETSIYLAIDPSLVHMDEAVKEISFPPSKFFAHDLIGGGSGPSLGLMEYWSTLTETGIMGDPTVATAEKGEKALDASASGLVEIIEELQSRLPRKRVDHHSHFEFELAKNLWE